jgi:ankyrin repeat protein
MSYTLKVNREILKHMDPTVVFDSRDELMRQAIRNKDGGMVSYLIDNIKASPNYLSLACEIQNMDMVQLLLDKGADPNDYWGGPIIEASTRGNLVLVKLLVEYGANINFPNAVSRAVHNNDIDMTTYLLSKMSIEDKRVAFKQIWLARDTRFNRKLLELFLEIEIIDTCDHHGNTILCKFTDKMDISMIELLLQHGADPNLVDKYGLCPKRNIQRLIHNNQHVDKAKAIMDLFEGYEIPVKSALDNSDSFL